MKAGRGSDQFPLRLPDGLRDHIKVSAERNGRSMNSEIIALLEQAYSARPGTVVDNLQAVRAFLDNEIARLQSSEAG